MLAEDSRILREGLVRLLEEEGVTVAGHTGDAADLLRLVDLHRPDAVLVDIRMPPTYTDEGLSAAAELRSRYPRLGVLVLSQYVETGTAVRMMWRDPRGFGYLLKDRIADVDDLVTAIRRVVAGESVIDPEVVSRLLARPRGHSGMDELTGRERQVLALMAEGCSNEAIAERLRLAAKTVETHVRNILMKLGLEVSVTDHRRVLAVLTYLGARPGRLGEG